MIGSQLTHSKIANILAQAMKELRENDPYWGTCYLLGNVVATCHQRNLVNPSERNTATLRKAQSLQEHYPAAWRG